VESETIARINLTVDDILQRCAGNDHSGCIDEALTDLSQQGWIEGEVDLVRSIVQRVLKERETG